MVGKLPSLLLEKHIFSRLDVHDPTVVKPMVGEDVAVIELDSDKALVIHSDPITGAVELLGWPTVNTASNGVAVMGAKPWWLLSTHYFPEDADEVLIDEITSQIYQVAKEFKAKIIGGCSGYTLGLKRSLMSMTVMSVVEKDKNS